LTHDDVIDALAMSKHYCAPCKIKTALDLTTVFEAKEERDSWGPLGPPGGSTRMMSSRGRGSQRLPVV